MAQRKSILSIIAFLLCAQMQPATVYAENFDDVEIRVIRPRYFNKSGRFELGASVNMIMNETFINTYLATGIASFHINEFWALEGSFSYGTSLDKQDKRILFDEFEIKTQIVRTNYISEMALQWTPIYGKWQLASGRLVYFDTYLQMGGGMTGVDWQYSDFCDTPDFDLNPDAEAVPANVVKSYPTFMIGAGQRYFVNKSQAYKFDFRLHRFLYNTLDAECSPAQVEASGDYVEGFGHDTITLQFGTSFFF